MVCLQFALIFGHRPWLDEVQALQLAVQAPDIATLLDWLRYEGHPPLFYLLLRGLAHFMDPLQTLPVLAAILAAITQFCILFRSPFTRAERLAIALSEFVLIEFLTLSRSMTLGVALLVLAMTIWRSRAVWVVIAVLPFCDFLFGVLSGVLVLLKLREGTWFWPGLAAWLVGGIGSAWTVMPPPDMQPALESMGLASDLLHYLTALAALAVPFQGGLLPQWNTPPFPLAGVLWIPFLLLAWYDTAGDRLHRVLLFGFLGLTFVFSMLVYPLAIRHLMLAALLLILLSWRRRSDRERPHPGFRLWIVSAAVCGIATAAINLAVPFDTARETVAKIERSGLAKNHWMVFPDSRAQVVSAMSGIDFERTERHCMQSAIRWDYRTTLLKPRLLERYLRSEVERHGRFYLLSDLDLDGIDSAILRQIAKIPAGYNGQRYNLYVVGPGAPERAVDLPPCIPGRRPLASF